MVWLRDEGFLQNGSREEKLTKTLSLPNVLAHSTGFSNQGVASLHTGFS